MAWRRETSAPRGESVANGRAARVTRPHEGRGTRRVSAAAARNNRAAATSAAARGVVLAAMVARATNRAPDFTLSRARRPRAHLRASRSPSPRATPRLKTPMRRRERLVGFSQVVTTRVVRVVFGGFSRRDSRDARRWREERDAFNPRARHDTTSYKMRVLILRTRFFSRLSVRSPLLDGV